MKIYSGDKKGNPVPTTAPAYMKGDKGDVGATGAPGVVQSVVAGANTTVDNTDPAHPIIASTGGGSGATTYAALTDSGSVDLPTVNTPLATALGLKASNTTLSSHTGSTSNPHSVTKAQVGLGSVDNTADVNKPVSTATQTALNGKVNNAQVLTNVPAGALFTDTVYTHPANHPASIITQDASNRFVSDTEKAAWNAKQAALVSGANIKTIDGNTLLGSGNITISGGADRGDVYATSSSVSVKSAYDSAVAAGKTRIVVYVPATTVSLGGSFVVPSTRSLTILGESPTASIINMSNGEGIQFQGWNNYVLNVKVQYTSQSTTGYTFKFTSAYNGIKNVFVSKANSIVEFIGSNYPSSGGSTPGRNFVNALVAEDTRMYGMTFDNAYDTTVSDVQIYGIVASSGAPESQVATSSVGLKLNHWTNALQFINCNFLIFERTLDITGNAVVGQSPMFNKFNACFFDSGKLGARIFGSISNEFVNCWFSNGRVGNSPGFEISQSTGTKVLGGSFVNNGTNGVYAYQAPRTHINEGIFIGNSVSSASSYGAAVLDGCTQSMISNSIVYNLTGSYGTQSISFDCNGSSGILRGNIGVTYYNSSGMTQAV